MPTYEYRCEKCGEQFEIFQSFSDRALRRHPECGGPVEKVLHPRGIVFKGSGFYVTDSRVKSSSSSESGATNGASEKGITGDSKPKDPAASEKSGGSEGSKAGTTGERAKGDRGKGDRSQGDRPASRESAKASEKRPAPASTRD